MQLPNIEHTSFAIQNQLRKKNVDTALQATPDFT